MLPFNRFLSNPNSLNDDKDDNEEGIEPFKALSMRKKTTMLAMVPNEEGMVPVRALLDTKESAVRLVKSAKSSDK